MARKKSPNGHPRCPECDMGMLVVEGHKLDRERQALECLRCGHFEKSAMPKNYPQAAE
jgi:uncharacterized paraquat-inducible protein A